MKTSIERARERHRRQLAPEMLEERVVMSAGQGSTFAIIPATITSSSTVTSTPFTINSADFTPNKHGKLTLGIDVTAVSTSSSASANTPTANVAPMIMSVTSSSGKVIRVSHTHYYPKIAKANHLGKSLTSAVLFTIPAPKSGSSDSYTVQVKGLDHTTGEYLLGFYLPGDVAGTGTVTKTDITTIKSLIGDAATNSNYNFDADLNRDGIINRQDVKLAEENLGEGTTISPVVSVNLNPADDPNSDRTTQYSTVNFAGEVSPGATVTFANTNNNGAQTTTTADSSGDYNIMVPLVSGSNTFTVTTKDAFGQSISGNIAAVVYDPNGTSS